MVYSINIYLDSLKYLLDLGFRGLLRGAQIPYFAFQ